MRYTKTHEWARQEGELIAVGITPYAVEQLNREIVFVELPSVGRSVEQGDTFGVIEAVKTAADLYAPVSGTIEEVNNAVAENPSLLAESPEGDGWLVKIRPTRPEQWQTLLTADEYRTHIENEGHH